MTSTLAVKTRMAPTDVAARRVTVATGGKETVSVSNNNNNKEDF